MSTREKRKKDSGLSGNNAAYLDALYEDYLFDPKAVDTVWRDYFDLLKKEHNEQDCSHSNVKKNPKSLLQTTSATTHNNIDDKKEKQLGVLNLIHCYRFRGHRHADIDPAKIRDRQHVKQITLDYHGLSTNDLNTVFMVQGAFNQSQMRLGDLIEKLESTYTTHIGLEYGHLWEQEEIDWLTQKMEFDAGQYQFSVEEKKQFLRELVAADGMEKYLHNRFIGQKRFSLEGGDALIPLLNTLTRKLAAIGTEKICIGMAHRGRLNVLINILGKKPQMLFDEFDGKLTPAANHSGDVKYHMGFSSFIDIEGKKVDLTLSYNPSHLEFVNAVTMGSARARLERRRMRFGATTNILDICDAVVPVIIHGDAALAGQGVNQETLQLSQLQGYEVGGSIHITVNNQIGFTTSNLRDARSSMYCTDIAKCVQVPILHVNGDNPEAIAFAGELAVNYLHKFKKDIFIDIVCYRRLGHNEADEPSATQPKMYEKIRSHDVPAKIYADKLTSSGVIQLGTYAQYQAQYIERLERGECVAQATEIAGTGDYLSQEWKALSKQDWTAPVDTTISVEQLRFLGKKAFSVPPDFNTHKLVEKILNARLKMSEGKLPLDWGCAENLAYASLLDQGFQVRISGEDCGRGTFSHRHAVVHNQDSGNSYTPLQHLKGNQPSIHVIDSLLSETGVLGFEYGYSLAEPRGLCVWEAQFGDFANVAQVIIDQFISSGEAKWGRYSGLVLLLPHGYEGQGPEHSSARLERYLQLSANNNWQICSPTTPAQVFHMLRRQVLRQFRKPLVVMSPKSLLRHKLAVSNIDELAEGRFQEVINEVDVLNSTQIKRIILCSGKVYYDLLQQRRESQKNSVAIIRIEQLYPFPHKTLSNIIARYSPKTEIIWCQEEPRNQGAWHQIYESLKRAVNNRKLHYCGRSAAASTAAGYAKIHLAEQRQLINQAFDLK